MKKGFAAQREDADGNLHLTITAARNTIKHCVEDAKPDAPNVLTRVLLQAAIAEFDGRADKNIGIALPWGDKTIFVVPDEVALAQIRENAPAGKFH